MCGVSDMGRQLEQRERESGIKPDPTMDAYVKGLRVEGKDAHLITEYVLKVSSPIHSSTYHTHPSNVASLSFKHNSGRHIYIDTFMVYMISLSNANRVFALVPGVGSGRVCRHAGGQ